MVEYANVAVIGLWHLGTVTAACLAEYGHNVVGIDPNGTVVENLKKGVPPVYEPGLEDLVKKCAAMGRLSFTSDFGEELRRAQYVAITFDTPINEDDTPDLTPIMRSITEVIPYLAENSMIVVSSQVPIGTCERIMAAISKGRPGLKFSVVCIPENLKLGEAIARFSAPDFIVIGAERGNDFEDAAMLYGFMKGPVLKVGLRTAEMTKHALNAFLACEVSFANELGNLCDSLGVDAFSVAEALHLDRRIGKGALLQPGLGFAGGTLARDVGILRALGKESGAETKLLDAIVNVNKAQNRIVAGKLKLVFGKIKGLKIGVLGLTYKPGTSTIRRSASIDIIRELVGRGADVVAYDPKADFDMAALGIKFERCKKAPDVAVGSDAVLILTGWPEFRELDFGKMKGLMHRRVVIDATNMLDGDVMSGAGFVYIGIGRGQQGKANGMIKKKD